MNETSEFEELMSRFKIIHQQIDDIVRQRDSLYQKQDLLEHELYYLSEKIFWELPPVKSDGGVELRKTIDGRNAVKEDMTGEYSICLANEKEVVGHISYRGYHVSDYLGDIGYTVYPEFRGNNFSYRALCMLGELLKENGVDDFWISTYKSNTPSVKVIEKYGGMPIKEDDYYSLYRAETFINEKQLGENVSL